MANPSKMQLWRSTFWMSIGLCQYHFPSPESTLNFLTPRIDQLHYDLPPPRLMSWSMSRSIPIMELSWLLLDWTGRAGGLNGRLVPSEMSLGRAQLPLIQA